jgi:hypothetical protein
MEDFTCIVSNNEMSEGLFGMVILYIFEILPILEEYNVDVSKIKWDVCTTNYGSIFPMILEYNSEFINSYKIDTKMQLFDLRASHPQYTLGDDFSKLNQLFFKYFKIPQYLELETEKYDQMYNLQNSLGIHFRGTDKTTDYTMNDPLTINEFYIIIDSFLKNNSDIKNVFLATDEPGIHDYLKNKYDYIHFATSRNFNNNLFWRNNSNVIGNGREAMIDMLCLSKCKVVLKVSSALSAFSKIINPNLNIFRLNGLKMFTDIPYFPDAYIPLLEQNENYTEECNRILDKIQMHDWAKTHKYSFNNFYYKLR